MNKKLLLLEISYGKLIFSVVEFDKDVNLKLIDKHIENAQGFKDGKIVDINQAYNNIQNILKKIEKSTDHIFTKINIVTDQINFECINISGFKKLRSSQILNVDISFIINNLKRLIYENNEKKSIIHLFNTKFILDDNIFKNIPIGLHGEFYNHQLTFFLLKENDLKNLRLLFGKCNLSINRIFLKSFIEGVELIQNNDLEDENFCKIKINDNFTHVSLFEKSSYMYSEYFNFGTNMIISDIMKVCSLKRENVLSILSDLNFDEIRKKKEENFLDKKYFKNENYRKISYTHLLNIIDARILEIINLIYNKNINLHFMKTKLSAVYVEIYDKFISINLKNNFLNNVESKGLNLNYNKTQENLYQSLISAAELITKGWSKEAIPIKQEKKSIISRFFSTLFG